MTKWFQKAFIAIVLVLSMVLPVLTPVAYAAGEAGTGELKDYNSMTMEQIFALDEDLTWVVTGDSITHNTSFTQGQNSYTEWFEMYLHQTGRAEDTVINTAWGGADIQDFLYPEDTPGANGIKADGGMGLEQFITRHNPDIITIKLGMNNRPMSDSNFKKYYNLMLDSIYAEGEKNGKIPKIIIITPTPVSNENMHNQDQTDKDSVWRFQKNLKGIAEDRGLLFVDFQTTFCTMAEEMGADKYRATFFSDGSDGGIHPNAAGQYLMFKTLSKVLGIYDESMPIFQLDYDDMLYASIWDDKTASVNLGYAPDVELNTDADKTQMNSTMPAAPSGTNLLSYIEFTDSTGYFDGTGTHTVDLTDAALGDGALTFAEAQSLGKSFSVVFRAKLGLGGNTNAGLFMISGSGLDKWDNSLTVGVPSQLHQAWYSVMKGRAATNNPNGQLALDGMNIANDGDWHTVAFTVTDSAFNYYVDGKLVKSTESVASIDIGSLITNAATYAAHFGKYGHSDATSYTLKGNFDYWQFYSGELTAEQVKTLAGSDCAGVEASTWIQAYAENNLWAVVGADQMSGYQGMYVNRSLFHLLEGTIRATGNQPQHYRDIRLLNLAAPGYTISDMAARLATKDFEVLLLLPEVSHVYADGYVHTPEQLADYKASVKALLAQYKDKVRILWTPLADDDATINGYLNDYANVVREIAEEDSSILFWDANAFMNENMQSNPSLLNNWFDGDMYITPLAANDLGRGFFTTVQTNGVPIMTLNELSDHNLRQGTDKRYFKNSIMWDNIASEITVSETTISMDLTAIVNAGYNLSDVQFKVIPSVGYGDHNEAVYTIPAADITVNGNVYSFEAPCSNPVIAVYADSHRFQDMAVKVTTSATLPSVVIPPATDLTVLEVIGAPDFGFSADTSSYEIELYQYQSHVQIIGTAAYGQTITVNGEEVLSGERSAFIPVGDGTTVTVKANGKAYTLNLSRPEYPDIIITEVMQDTTDEKYDMLEIYNASGKDLDLKDYSIGFKKDYSWTKVWNSNNQWPYYFLGNSTSFHSARGATTNTGINPITKYSTYTPDAVNEPDSIPFPADSTMVIWVRRKWTNGLTYDDLIKDLTDKADGSNYDNKTLTVNGTAVVPGKEQLVVAEVPLGVEASGQSAYTKYQYGYLENHTTLDDSENDMNARTWLFILDKNAKQHYFNGITEAGDDIYSAAMMSRVSTSQNLSTVLYYNVERGMSIVEDAGLIRGAPATGYTSDQSGYMNLTTFGAIEHWQKPYDLDDATKPEVKDNSKDGTISLTFKDDTDIRFMAICIDTDGDGEYDEVIKKDWVLESSAASSTGTTETKAERTYTLSDLPKDVKYYGYVLDDNNNKTTFGNGDPMDDFLANFGKDAEEDSSEGTTGGNSGSTGNTGSNGDNTTGGSTGSTEGSTGNGSTDATEGTTGSAGTNSGTAGSNTTGSSTSSSVSGNTGNTGASPSTGNGTLQIILVATIVLVSAAIITVMGVIGYKYKKLNG